MRERESVGREEDSRNETARRTSLPPVLFQGTDAGAATVRGDLEQERLKRDYASTGGTSPEPEIVKAPRRRHGSSSRWSTRARRASVPGSSARQTCGADIMDAGTGMSTRQRRRARKLEAGRRGMGGIDGLDWWRWAKARASQGPRPGRGATLASGFPFRSPLVAGPAWPARPFRSPPLHPAISVTTRAPRADDT